MATQVTLNSGSVDSAGSLALKTNGTTTAVTIDTSQNVGIGNTSPSQALVVGNGASDKIAIINGKNTGTGGGASLIVQNNSSSISAIGNSSGIVGGAYDANSMLWAANTQVFSVNGSERMRIDSSGNLLVGTTSAPNTSFVSKSNFIGLQTTNSLDSSKWRQIVFATSASDATLYFPNGSNTPTLSSAGAWTNASDGRQKTNITDIKYGLDTVLASQPHSYNRTDVDGDFIGFVAQELKTVIPEVVFGSDETSYSVDYGSLVAVAFKAIQEQQALITTLTDRITALEAK